MSAQDPRVELLARALESAGGREAMPREQSMRAAEEALGELDELSTDATVRRLQAEVVAAWNGEDVDFDLGRAMQLTSEIDICKGVQSSLKQAFAGDELDGGWKTALEHPLFVKAQARIDALRDELKGLF